VPPADDQPQIVALIELDEGPRLMSNLVGVTPAPSTEWLDARVTVDFEARGAEMLPVFRPVASEGLEGSVTAADREPAAQR
jgi:uncharacterized OB-fold protein